MRVPAVSPSVCMPRNSRFARRDSTAPFSSWRPRRLRPASEDELIEHCQSVARELPVIGFYLHAAVGGMALSRSFWTRFAGIDNVIAIKVAPFDRYKTLDVAFGVVAAAAEDRLTLYTGNDDHIIADLVTPMRIGTPGREVVLRFNPRCTGQGTHAPVRAGSAMAQSVTTTTRGKLTMKIDDDTWNAIVAETKGRIADWNDRAAEKGRPGVFEVRATTGDSYQLLITIHHDHGRGTRRRYRQAAQGDKNQGGHQNISSAKGLDKARRQTRRDDRVIELADELVASVPGEALNGLALALIAVPIGTDVGC